MKLITPMKMMRLESITQLHPLIRYTGFIVLPLLCLFCSLLIGPSHVLSYQDYLLWFWQSLFGGSYIAPEQYALMQNILWNVRLPRILLTFMVGAALATAGNGLQALFRNPLVDSYVLGISSGAAFGAALALSFNLNSPNLLAFIFGIAAVLLTYLFAYQKQEQQTSLVMIILAGMIVSGLFLAGLTIIQYISDPFKLQAIVQWTMGNLHQANWNKVQYAVLPICIGLLGLFLMRWRLNLLALGTEEAQAVGINPKWEQILLIGLVTLCTSASVAAAGIISLYGLFMPHIVRILVGPDHRATIPCNMILGGCFLLLIDNFSRVLLSFEIPIGIFTMLLGAPFFFAAHEKPADELVMIHIHQLNFAYGQKQVLKNIDLSFAEHQFSVILGRNGCGKSTLFRLMAGLEPLQCGSILYKSKRLDQYKGKRRAELLGFLPQFHKTVFPFKVKDVVLTGRAAFSHFHPTKQDEYLVDQALEELDIGHLKHQAYTELSGGERQLVMIARILVQAPKVILLDEPTNHLDVYYQSYLMKKLRQLSRQNYTVIAIMHDPNLAFLFADELFFMRQHEIIRPESRQRLTDPVFLKSVYDVEFHEAMIQDKTIVVPDYSWL